MIKEFCNNCENEIKDHDGVGDVVQEKFSVAGGEIKCKFEFSVSEKNGNIHIKICYDCRLEFLTKTWEVADKRPQPEVEEKTQK